MSEFETALHFEVGQPHFYTGRLSGKLLDGFVAIVRRAIDSAGIGGLTRDEFLAIVAKAFDLFIVSMGIPPMLVPLLKAAVLVIAGRMWDKRNKPVPAV